MIKSEDDGVLGSFIKDIEKINYDIKVIVLLFLIFPHIHDATFVF